jgi:redox-sensing transcriptional repressor
MEKQKVSSLPTIRRLPSYLYVVRRAAREGHEVISGTVIAQELELEPIQVRKDLALTGVAGRPRIGYPVQDLIASIESFLSWDQRHNAAVVGTGSLGTALMGYEEFQRHGLNIVAAFDTDADKVGTTVRGRPVHHTNELQEAVAELGIEIAILTVPSPSAQAIAEQLIDAGIRSIWNFTNVKLKVPSDVVVQKEDVSSGYAVLSVRMGIRDGKTILREPDEVS